MFAHHRLICCFDFVRVTPKHFPCVCSFNKSRMSRLDEIISQSQEHMRSLGKTKPLNVKMKAQLVEPPPIVKTEFQDPFPVVEINCCAGIGEVSEPSELRGCPSPGAGGASN